MKVPASNFGTKLSTDLRIAAAGGALATTACNAPSPELSFALLIASGGAALVGSGLYRWGKARSLYQQACGGQEEAIDLLLNKAQESYLYAKQLHRLAQIATSGSSPQIQSYFTPDRLSRMVPFLWAEHVGTQSDFKGALEKFIHISDQTILRTLIEAFLKRAEKGHLYDVAELITITQKVRKGEISGEELHLWMKIAENLGSRAKELTMLEGNLLMRVYIGRGNEVSRDEVIKDLFSSRWSPKYILAYRLLFHFFQPQEVSSTQRLLEIVNQGGFWGTVAYHVFEDKQLSTTSPFPNPYVKRGSNGHSLLTRLGQLTPHQKKYVLVETPDRREFRIGSDSHMEMVSLEEADTELVIGAGFIWVDSQSGDIMIDGKSGSFTTSLDDVSFNYSFGQQANSAGLKEVQSHLIREIFKQWSSVRVKIS